MASASDLLINKLKINDAVSIRINQVIQSSKNWYSDHPSPEHFHENRPPDEVFNLQGYIVAKNGQNRYEVQIPGETYRALLYTSGTTYTTKGSFTLLVTKKGTEIVTIKEDYGGFTQEWNEYEEASDSEIKRWNAYLNRENGQADHTKLYNETLRPILENLEREEQTEIENTMRRYQSLSNEIRENYKKCFVL
ncbi:MAG: hypothetical protein EDM75_07430 [Chlorobiota bacterium]|nr:MAG: hypothetical protein EDM75_07430 [Chlorobiota bacterium]